MWWLTVLTYVVILGLVHCGLITFCGSLVVWSSKRLVGRMTGRPFISFLNPLEGLASRFSVGEGSPRPGSSWDSGNSPCCSPVWPC